MITPSPVKECPTKQSSFYSLRLSLEREYGRKKEQIGHQRNDYRDA